MGKLLCYIVKLLQGLLSEVERWWHEFILSRIYGFRALGFRGWQLDSRAAPDGGKAEVELGSSPYAYSVCCRFCWRELMGFSLFIVAVIVCAL